MNFVKIQAVFFIFLVKSAEAMIKRADENSQHLLPPPKHTKLNEDFVTEFRKWDVKKLGKIDFDLAAPFLGHGGTYEALQPLVSKMKTVESDHAPHYSLLDYVNLEKVRVNELPENIRSVVEKRKMLQDQLQKTDYPKNEQRLKILKQEMDALGADLNKPIRVNKWDPQFQNEFKANIKEITKIEKETAKIQEKTASGDASSELQLARNKEKVNQLLKKNTELRANAEKSFKTPEKQERLVEVTQEFAKLEKVNKDLSKSLNEHNSFVKKAMGALSIPYDKHRIFPSTGNAGLDDEIRGLKNADAATAKVAMEGYDKAWVSNMNEGIKKGYFKNVDDFAIKTADGKFAVGTDGKKLYDYQKLWEHNFDSIVDGAQGDKVSDNSKSKPMKGKKTHQAIKTDYMKRLHATHAKRFITQSIYYIKTPEMGYSRLVNLYISEYKIYLKNDFNDYKSGVQQLLEANNKFGWINEGDMEQLKTAHKLADIDSIDDSSMAQARKANQWNEVEELIKFKTENSDNPLVNGKVSTVDTITDKVCSSSSRKKRSASSNGCIFFTKRHQADSDINSHSNKRPDLDLEENIRKPKSPNTNVDGPDLDAILNPKINLPSDIDTLSIDSKQLNNYLTQLDDGDINSVRIKESLVDHISRNSDKLTGTPEDIARTKALISLENLDTHSQQNALARNTLRNNGGDTPPKALSKYQKVKLSTSKFAAKAGKFTSSSSKVSGSYGKIMLAKGVVTALRHGDYESLALIGGRIGLEFALQGVTKLGKHIAKKATTKFMTKLGSQIIGNMAAPIGAIADIGMNVYSITKSVKILRDPRASKFDQNDAIADIVADSIDIAVTATAAVLSLVFPPLAPFFAVAAFVVNIFTTLVVAFYKAANHVDRVNDQMPLLDFERTNEYWRYIGGQEISGYIQDLIDIKKANNIAVNLTVQFLINNPYYIGKVFPSRTMHDPEASCGLERRKRAKMWHLFSFSWSGWAYLSDCDGLGEKCEGGYSSRKCQTDSGSEYIPFFGHANVEYRCKCGSDPPPVWGYEILDNEVDFTQKRNVYLQRAAPDFNVPADFRYQCKPSSMRNEGKRVSKPYTNWEYLCQGAIAVMRKNSKGKFMLYDLGNGTDRITLSEGERVDNLFVVQEGTKYFYGNAGDDTFEFVGPCFSTMGTFDGKGYKDQGNSIVLDSNCYRWGKIQVDLGSGTMKFGSNSASVYLRNIHRVIGRKEETESITANCYTKLVSGGGGRLTNGPDVVVVPSCGEFLDLTVSVEGSTLLDASRFSNGKVFILLQGRPTFRSKVPRNFLGTLFFKFDVNVGSLTTASVDSGATTVRLGFSNGGTSRFEFNGNPTSHSQQRCETAKNHENQISIVISENRQFSRQLVYDLGLKRVQCSFRLERETNLAGSIYGYDFLDNVFHLKSGNWAAFGGKLANQFILSGSEFSGSIDGRTGQNSLHILNQLMDVSRLEIDLNSGYIRWRNTISIRNIENVYGRPDYTEHVTTACNTKSLDLGGTERDQVDIPALSCFIELTITVKGKSAIIDRKSSGTLTIQAGYERRDPCAPTPQPLALSVSYFGSGETTLLLNFQMHQILSASPNWINIDGGSRVILTGNYPNIYFEEDYELKSALIKEEGNIIAYHELSNLRVRINEPKIRRGTNGIQNIFKLAEGTNWEISGGQLDDTFILVSNSFNGKINGGLGRNSFYIENEINGIVEIESNTVRIQGSTRNTVALTKISEMHGRVGQPEKITVSCDIQHVEMNGGHFGNPDIITIPKMSCNRKMTVVAMGYTKLSSLREEGNADIYMKTDTSNNLKVNSDILVTSSTIFNFPIKYPAYKLRSYDLKIVDNENLRIVKLYLTLADNNFVEFIQKYNLADYLAQKQNVNLMFVDMDFNSNGNILINDETTETEINILHVLQMENIQQSAVKTRRGATGAKNVFRLYSGNWDAFGGTLDDSFIMNDDSFTGTLHGLGGVNSLILTESLTATHIILNLNEKSLNMDSSVVTVNSIQIVGGRKGKQEKLICACDTKLVMLDGGSSSDRPDEIDMQQSFCRPEVSIIVAEFTTIENSAIAGNFTYHIRTSKHFDIQYNATLETNHAFKFETTLDQFKNISVIESSLKVNFDNDTVKRFPLNFQNLPTFHIGQGPELVAEIILEENETVQCSIVARSPYSGTILGLNGAENKIVVDTSSSIQSIIGGDKDDNIFLSQVQSVLLINGRGGTNRLHLDNELHQGKRMEVDFIQEKIIFLDGSPFSSFVTVVKGIALFSGRENDFERVVLGCDTNNVRFAEEVIIRKNCEYEVRIQVGVGTRVIFELENEDDPFREMHNDLVEVEEEDDDDGDYSNESDSVASVHEAINYDDEINIKNDDEDTLNVEMITELNPSTFYYHFSSIHSFDIEVDKFHRLRQSRHIFYLNFTLSQLTTLRFSLNESRIIYTTFEHNELEFSHVVGGVDDTAMFYSQPEFMSGDGFLLRATRYGEIVAIVANPQENLDLNFIQQDVIPRLATYSSKLGISFMLETGSDFVYCGNPNEVNLLTNRENVTSHLVGFNQTTYEILDLDNDVFIYPQFSNGHGTAQVLDLSNIISQIRNETKRKYVPEISRIGDNLEIEMTNWTDTFRGKVILVNGTFHHQKISILLNSIAMEILPPGGSADGTNRRKRSIDQNEESWEITPSPIIIPEGHSYIFAAEDLEDGVEVKKESSSSANEENVSFQYSKDENDLIITSMNAEEIESGKATTFAIFDYYSSDSELDTKLLEDGNETDVISGKVEKVNNIQIKLGNENVSVSSNEPIVSEETGEEMEIQFYEDILDKEESKILEVLPEMPRQFKVSWQKKIGRTTEYWYAVWMIILSVTILMGSVIYKYCRKKPEKKGKYFVNANGKYYQSSIQDEKEAVSLQEFSEENIEDYEEPRLIHSIQLSEDTFM